MTRYEAVRAVEPNESGRAEVDGVAVHWDAYGRGERTLLFLAPWNLFHSRAWKLQVPYLAQRARVVVYDPPGNGRSDRPHERERLDDDAETRYALGVMDAIGASRVVLAGVSRSTRPVFRIARDHPDRVEGAILISSWFTTRSAFMRWLAHPALVRAFNVRAGRGLRGRAPMHGPLAWSRFNAEYWKHDLDGFMDWFVDYMTLQEPYSSRLIEEARGWGHEADRESVIESFRPGALAFESVREQRAIAGAVSCPALVIHGSDDRIFPLANAQDLADRLPNGKLHVIAGGHGSFLRRPAEANRAIDEFLDSLPGNSAREPLRARPTDKRRRVLWWCSPLGLGHTQRDLAIARELRALRPDVEIDWLAESPVRETVEREGERVHPASALLPSECRAFEAHTREHHLHAMEAWRACNEVALAEFMVFRDAAAATDYDLWVGDEAWGIDHHLHENPGEKRAPYAWLADFIGIVPLPSDSDAERDHCFEWNRQFLEHMETARVRDLSLYVGDPDDLVDETFGPGLPRVRDWAARNYEFPGWIGGYDPRALPDRDAVRAELGWRPGEIVCVMSVGGSGAGEALLRRGVQAVGALRERIPGVRIVAVCGPRIDPARLPAADGVEVLPYVHNLHRLLYACDVALAQGGLSTCMELTAAKRPFVYVPLEEHFEQQVHVHHRLERYRAGRRLRYDNAGPDAIAETIAAELARRQDVRAIHPGGARRAAERLATLIPG